MDDNIRATLEWIENSLNKFNETAITLEHAIGEYLEWMATNGYMQSTRESYRRALEHFLSFIKIRRYYWDEVFTLPTLARFNQLKRRNIRFAVTGLSRYLHAQGKVSKPLGLEKSSASLGGLFDDYLRYRKKYHQAPERTIRACERVLAAFAAHIQGRHIKIEKLSIEQIDAFLIDFLKGFSDATRSAYRGHLRGFLSYLFHERQLLSRDLAPLVTGPPVFAPTRPPRFLHPDEVKKLFAGLTYETASDLRNAAVIHLAYMLGLRPQEIRSLKLDDINFGKAEICLRQRKNNRPDKLPLPEPAVKALAAYLVGGRGASEHRTLFLTLHPPCRPLSPTAVSHCIRNCLRKAGLDAIAYWLRHTYAQNLLEIGSSLYEVKEMLGHDSIESTRKYLHIHLKLMRKVLFDETL